MKLLVAGVDASWADCTRQEMAAMAEVHRKELRAAERAGRFPEDVYRAMASAGWVGPMTPVEFGGLGGGVGEYCLIAEEVGRCGLVSPQTAIQGQQWLLDWGTPDQRQRYLSGIATGELVFSESISEPGVGSSFKSMRATATRDDDDWVLNGTKVHVNLGCESDLTLFYANAPEGLTAFLVGMQTEGVATRPTDPIGLRLIPTAEVDFADVRVPTADVLGEPGRGLDTFLTTFNVSRLGNASELLGLAARALCLALDYARERPVGDGVVTDFQGIQWKVADCYSAFYAAALVRNDAVLRVLSGEEHSLETSLAKKLAIEAAELAAAETLAFVGGHGLYHDSDLPQIVNDIKVLRVAGGSHEILRNYVARQVLRSPTYEGLR